MQGEVRADKFLCQVRTGCLSRSLHCQLYTRRSMGRPRRRSVSLHLSFVFTFNSGVTSLFVFFFISEMKPRSNESSICQEGKQALGYNTEWSDEEFQRNVKWVMSKS